MAIENKFERVEYDADPERCQGMGAAGQCPYKRSPGSNFCERHGANKAREAKDKAAVRTYQLRVFEERKNQLADDGKIKSLREEIAILRMTMEAIINKCENENDLITNAGKISDMSMKLEKLVVSCNTLETKLGMLLDRNHVIQLASVIVEIASEFVVDAEQREKMSERILDSLLNSVLREE